MELNKKKTYTLHRDERNRVTAVVYGGDQTLISSVVYVGNTEEIQQLSLLGNRGNRVALIRERDGEYVMCEASKQPKPVRNVHLNQESGALLWVEENQRKFLAPVGCGHIRQFGHNTCLTCESPKSV
jgi:hypothetical protein